jgi:hypothetical protein
LHFVNNTQNTILITNNISYHSTLAASTLVCWIIFNLTNRIFLKI